MGGTCESRKNMNDMNNNIPQINTEKGTKSNQNSNLNMKEEAIFPGKSIYINDQQLKTITHQKDNSICKILKNDKPFGTGFLCSIPDEYKIRKTLITVYHVLQVRKI